jgi:hypothetical protein
MPVILVTWEVEMRRITIQGQPGQKVSENPSQPIKAGHGGGCLSSQLCRKHKIGECDSSSPMHKCGTLFEK